MLTTSNGCVLRELLAKTEQAARLLNEVHVDISDRATSDDEDECADNLCDDARDAVDKLATHLRHEMARGIVRHM